MSNPLNITEVELQAFVDGQLPPERRRTMMAHLAAQSDDAQRVDSYRNLNEGLHELFDGVLREPLPARLQTERYATRRARVREVRRLLTGGGSVRGLRAAMVAVLMLAGGAGGFWVNEAYFEPPAETPAMSFARQAAQAHMVFAPDLRYPVEFGADQQDSLLLWLSERLGETVHAPDLADLGFDLVGGRLLPASGQPAAQLMYEGSGAERITLYIRGRWLGTNPPPMAAGQELSVSYAAEGRISMVYWLDGPLAYALIGELNREQLFSTAKIIQQQLHLPTLAPPKGEQTAEKDAT